MLDKKFNPTSFEKKHYDNWLDNKYFKADINKNKTPFTIVMPPPNITSKLHIGHAFGITIMDTIARFKRMQGYETLLLPGTDHAAIATEAKVVERLASQGIKKTDLGREKFLEKMYDWYDEFGSEINEQFKLVGISADWDKYAFTLDEKRTESVREAFVTLYNKSLIYQGNRITNWCPKCKTAISDIEVEYEDNNGHLWHINYEIEGAKGKFITVATTRPETMFGDVAVAVNPNDKRYKSLIGKNVILPIVNKLIPVIADDYVDKSFGTGIVKITPAHDPNDYEIGLRHNLPQIVVMNLDGTLNQNAGKFEGIDRLVSRDKVVEELKNIGSLNKIEKYANKVGHCQRCHEIVEPMISKQWYVKMDGLAKEAIKVVKDRDINFIPKRFEKTYFNWLNNIKDWCISRQIWSGHRIPVWYNQDNGDIIVEKQDPTTMEKYKGMNLVQDEDSLDTWFSSALWPFSTLGWPEKTQEMDYFFPTDLMVTGYDIIFFWVARMIFSSLEYTGKIPFKDVLFHGLVRDNLGRKMSKSLGNGIDPIEIINSHGADAMRFAMLHNVGVGQDSKLGEEKIVSASNFLNKLWNASKFVLDNVEKINYTKINLETANLTLADKWILSELNDTIKTLTKYYAKYDIGLVLTTLYDFVWNKFCDWYIESSKVKLYSGSETEKNEVLNVLVHVLENVLKLMHPITPFVTEEIYLNLPFASKTIMLEEFPVAKSKLNFKNQHNIFEKVMELVRAVRNLRSELKIADNVKTDLVIIPKTNNKELQNSLEIIKKLAFGNSIIVTDSENNITENYVFAYNEIATILIPTGNLIDKEKELQRLNAELENIEKELKRANGMLNNTGFVNSAPKQLIDKEKEKIEKYNNLKLTILQSIENLN